jgi:hypothetical protein
MGGRACNPGHPLLLKGVSARYVSVRQTFLEPVHDFSLNPTYAGGAEVNPLGELPGPFQTCDVLRRIQNQLLKLTL